MTIKMKMMMCLLCFRVTSPEETQTDSDMTGKGKSDRLYSRVSVSVSLGNLVKDSFDHVADLTTYGVATGFADRIKSGTVRSVAMVGKSTTATAMQCLIAC